MSDFVYQGTKLTVLSRNCMLTFRVAVPVTPCISWRQFVLSWIQLDGCSSNTIHLALGKRGGEVICCLTQRASMFCERYETLQKLYFPAITSKRPILHLDWSFMHYATIPICSSPQQALLTHISLQPVPGGGIDL